MGKEQDKEQQNKASQQKQQDLINLAASDQQAAREASLWHRFKSKVTDKWEQITTRSQKQEDVDPNNPKKKRKKMDLSVEDKESNQSKDNFTASYLVDKDAEPLPAGTFVFSKNEKDWDFPFKDVEKKAILKQAEEKFSKSLQENTVVQAKGYKVKPIPDNKTNRVTYTVTKADGKGLSKEEHKELAAEMQNHFNNKISDTNDKYSIQLTNYVNVCKEDVEAAKEEQEQAKQQQGKKQEKKTDQEQEQVQGNTDDQTITPPMSPK